MEQLHPNLARMAAAYDDIFEQFARGQLSAADAKGKIRSLVARDDSGIEWSINPDDRSWYRRTVHGQWVQDTPPRMGVGTMTGWDLSGADPLADPRYRVADTMLDPRLATDPDNLRGSTARLVRNLPPEPVTRKTERTRWIIAAGLVAVTVAALIWFFTSWNSPLRDNPAPDAPAPTASVVPGA